jgi:Rrf2 family protein
MRALAYPAAEGRGRWVLAREIAEAEGAPVPFLLKVLERLAPARLLGSARSSQVGYRLLKPATGITLLEVVEAVEGPIHGEPPFDGAGELGGRLQALCDQVAAMVRAKLGKVKLSDLAGKRRRRGSAVPAKRLKIPAALLAHYRDGELNINALAKILHPHQAKVTSELHRRGTRLPLAVARRRGFADAAALAAEVCELYARGRSLRQVARAVGLTVERARQILLRHGVKVRRQDYHT